MNGSKPLQVGPNIEYTRVALGCTFPPKWLVPTGVYLITFLIGNLSYMYSPCSEPSSTVLFPDVTYTMYARPRLNTSHPPSPLHIIIPPRDQKFGSWRRKSVSSFNTFSKVYSSLGSTKKALLRLWRRKNRRLLLLGGTIRRLTIINLLYDRVFRQIFKIFGSLLGPPPPPARTEDIQ